MIDVVISRLLKGAIKVSSRTEAGMPDESACAEGNSRGFWVHWVLISAESPIP
jgi:hypothetical protein